MIRPLFPSDSTRTGLFNWMRPGQWVRCVQPQRVRDNVTGPLGIAIDLNMPHKITRLVRRQNWTYFQVAGFDKGEALMFSAESASDGVELWEPIEL